MGLMLRSIGDPLGIAGGVGDARVGAIGDAKVDRQPIVNTQTCVRVELHDAALSAAREARRCAFAWNCVPELAQPDHRHKMLES
jgi:hypothetical protein